MRLFRTFVKFFIVVVIVLCGADYFFQLGLRQQVNELFGRTSSIQTMAGWLPRSKNMLSGSKLMSVTADKNFGEREQRFISEMIAGNVPDHLRSLHPIRASLKDRKGITHSLTFWVMPDYLAVGSNNDNIRVPLSPLGAQRVADRLGLTLPTRKMVDMIYSRAQIRLSAKPLPAGPRMQSNDFFVRHQAMVENELRQRGLEENDSIVAGHKKDVVLTSKLRNLPDRVAIYGWQKSDGNVVQPLSLVHGNHYADYSHGIRLVGRMMRIDGKNIDISEVLKDARYSWMIEDESIAPPVSYFEVATVWQAH